MKQDAKRDFTQMSDRELRAPKMFDGPGEARRHENEVHRRRNEKVRKKVKPDDRACFYAEQTCTMRKPGYYWALIPKGLTYEQAMNTKPPIKECCGPFGTQEKAQADFERAKQEATR